MKCLSPGPHSSARNEDKRTRGLCPRCYGRRLKQVMRGETTWEELERLGQVLPAQPIPEKFKRAKA